MCHAQQSQYGAILDQTKHVIFLDTPHHGLNEAAWRALSGGELGDSERKNWGLWQTVLSDLSSVFTGIAGRFNITSACASLVERDEGTEGQVSVFVAVFILFIFPLFSLISDDIAITYISLSLATRG